MWWRGQKAELQAEYQALDDDVALDPEIKEKLIAKYMLDVPILTVCQIIPDLLAELGKRHRVNRQTHLFRVAVTREMHPPIIRMCNGPRRHRRKTCQLSTLHQWTRELCRVSHTPRGGLPPES